MACTSAIDNQRYCLKFYARSDALVPDDTMLSHRELALVLPPARYVDTKEHRALLQGPVVVCRQGTPLEEVIGRDADSSGDLLASEVMVRSLTLTIVALRIDIERVSLGL